MIGSFESGANVSLVAKNGTKKIIPLLSIKSHKNFTSGQISEFEVSKGPQPSAGARRRGAERPELLVLI